MGLDVKIFRTVGIYLLALGLPVCIAAGIGTKLVEDAVPTIATQEENRPVLVLDPGHGGGDGGAVAVDGTTEKTLNLAVASRMEKIADLLGWDTRMTRTDDTMLYDLYGDFPTGGKKKSYDLKNRLRFAREANATVFCSIHMNQFPSSDCQGLQVYYSPMRRIVKDTPPLCKTMRKPTWIPPTSVRSKKPPRPSTYCTGSRLQPFWWSADFCPVPPNVKSSRMRRTSCSLPLCLSVDCAVVLYNRPNKKRERI